MDAVAGEWTGAGAKRPRQARCVVRDAGLLRGADEHGACPGGVRRRGRRAPAEHVARGERVHEVSRGLLLLATRRRRDAQHGGENVRLHRAVECWAARRVGDQPVLRGHVPAVVRQVGVAADVASHRDDAWGTRRLDRQRDARPGVSGGSEDRLPIQVHETLEHQGEDGFPRRREGLPDLRARDEIDARVALRADEPLDRVPERRARVHDDEPGARRARIDGAEQAVARGHARDHGLMALRALVEVERGAAAVERHRERNGARGLRRAAVAPQVAGLVRSVEVPEHGLVPEVEVAVGVDPYLTARVPQNGVRAAGNLLVAGVRAKAVPAGARRVVRSAFDAEGAVARVDRSGPSHARDVRYGVARQHGVGGAGSRVGVVA